MIAPAHPSGEPRSQLLAYEVSVRHEGVTRALDLLEALFRSPRAPLQVLGQTVLDDMVLPSFERQVSPDGVPWPKLRPGTLAKRQRAGFMGTTPLKITGTLRNSFNYQLAEGDTAVSIGTPRHDARYHQGDDTRPRRVIPERAMLPKPEGGAVSGSVAAALERALMQSVRDIIGGEGEAAA
jgi:hypothetical protein